MKGFSVDVLRWKYDCTNNGLSSRHEAFILCGTGVPEMYEPSAAEPGLILVRRTIAGKEYLHAQPINDPRPGNVGWMAGGNFIWSSDSRFPNRYPISIHDREETREQNKHLSI